MSRPQLLLLCILASFALVLVDSKIHKSLVDVDDRKLVPLTEAFGFADGGKLDVTIRDIAIFMKHDAEKNYNLDNFGFFLSPVEADAALEQDLADDTK